MLLLLLKFLYVIALSYCYGRVLCSRTPVRNAFPLVALSGLVLLSILAGWLSILLPMGVVANACVLVGAALCAAWNWYGIKEDLRVYRQQVKATAPATKVFFVLAVLSVLYLSSLESFTYDEGLYYAQFIKWTQYYPAVPGLANLHTRLGFNSEWQVLAALFNGGFLLGKSINQLNGVLYILLLAYLLKPFVGNLSSRLRMLLVVMIHLPWLGVYYFTAPAPDLVVYYGMCMLVLLWLEQLETDDVSARILIWALPVWLVTVKLSAAPVLLIPLIFGVQLLGKKQFKAFIGLAVVCAVTILPWLLRNVILSGYLLFPFEKLDLFAVDWKVPVAKARHTREVIEVYGYLRDKIPASEIHSHREMLVYLFKHNIRVYDMLLLAAVAASPVLVWVKRQDLPKGFAGLYASLLAGIVFWFIQAPDPRFGYGYLVPVALLGIALVWRRLPAMPVLGAALLLQVVTMGLQWHLHKVFTGKGMIAESTQKQFWLVPQPYTSASVVYRQLPFPHYVAGNADQCWDADLPCADASPDSLVLRGPDLREGFKPTH